MQDVKELIEAVRTRNGIRVEPDDPVFAFATINQLVLEDAARSMAEEISAIVTAFQTRMEKVEKRAGGLLANELKEAAAQVRAELQKDLDAAGLRAAHLVYLVDQAHKRPALARWVVVGLVSAAALFASGIWVGVHLVSP